MVWPWTPSSKPWINARTSGWKVTAVYTNKDYAPGPVKRDAEVAQWCGENQIEFHAHDDHVVCPPDAVLKDDGTPYTVFTPYSKKWHKTFEAFEASPLKEASVQLQGGLAPLDGSFSDFPSPLRHGIR